MIIIINVIKENKGTTILCATKYSVSSQNSETKRFHSSDEIYRAQNTATTIHFSSGNSDLLIRYLITETMSDPHSAGPAAIQNIPELANLINP